MGGKNSSPDIRFKAFLNSELPSSNFKNCFGLYILEIGQSLVPKPPERMTGRIFFDVIRLI
jgi:hypothetical protein